MTTVRGTHQPAQRSRPVAAAGRAAPAAGRNVWELVSTPRIEITRPGAGLSVPTRCVSIKNLNWFRRSSPDGASEKAGETISRAAAGDDHSLRAATAYSTPVIVQDASERRRQRLLVAGAAAHDLYHAGQIQLLKRLRER
jgi:hypothetical protein